MLDRRSSQKYFPVRQSILNRVTGPQLVIGVEIMPRIEQSFIESRRMSIMSARLMPCNFPVRWGLLDGYARTLTALFGPISSECLAQRGPMLEQPIEQQVRFL